MWRPSYVLLGRLQKGRPGLKTLEDYQKAFFDLTSVDALDYEKFKAESGNDNLREGGCSGYTAGATRCRGLPTPHDLNNLNKWWLQPKVFTKPHGPVTEGSTSRVSKVVETSRSKLNQSNYGASRALFCRRRQHVKQIDSNRK